MAVVPKPPAFDAAGFSKALTDNIKKPDGTSYAPFSQFTGYKQWNDKQRDEIEKVRVGVFGSEGIKNDVDEHAARLNKLESRMAAVEAQPVTRFP